MRFNLSSVTKFFSRAHHNVQGDKKNSASQFVTLHSNKTEKPDSKESSSKIARFFHKLFQSKEKARQGVENSSFKFPLVNIHNPIPGAPTYFVMLDETTTVTHKTPDEKKQAANSSIPKAESAQTSVSYNELDQHRSYIDSNEGRFMIDITNMGSCISDPQRYFRASTNLDLQKTLTEAF